MSLTSYRAAPPRGVLGDGGGRRPVASCSVVLSCSVACRAWLSGVRPAPGCPALGPAPGCPGAARREAVWKRRRSRVTGGGEWRVAGGSSEPSASHELLLTIRYSLLTCLCSAGLAATDSPEP